MIDRTLARPRTAWVRPQGKKLTEGVYDLYWGFGPLEYRDSEENLEPIKNPRPEDKPGYIHIGKIHMTKDGVSKGPAGVAWGSLVEE